jgi:thiosulfate reductase cytochrome b subunit
MDVAQPVTRTAETETAGEPKVLYKKHSLAVRWFHWINFPVLFLMIWSGMLIYWANDVFHVKLFGHDFFHFFPDSWWSPHAPKWVPNFIATTTPDDNGVPQRYLWSLDSRLAEGMGWHFLFAWLFTINGALYVSYLAFSGEWRKIVPHPRALLESVQVVLVDLHLSRKKLPVRKYNAAQQIAYTGVIVMGALMVLTGISIYKPSEQSWLTHAFGALFPAGYYHSGGYSVARFIHFWTTMAFLAFFVVHVGQVVKTGWNNFRGIITGYELVTPEEKELL